VTSPIDRMDQRTAYGSRAKLGLIVPPTNTANEAEWGLMAPAGVSIHSARMPLHTDTESAEGKAALHRDVCDYARDLAQASVDLIVYGCTAGSMVSPVTVLPDLMRKETGIAAITTAQAIIEALRALGVHKLSIGTPYHDALNNHEHHFLSDHGFEILTIEGLGYGANGPDEYRNIARVPGGVVEELAQRVDHPDADALLLSCTDLATLEAIPKLEKALGKPVVSSNSATLWYALRRAGITDSIAGFGQLLEMH
jgi:maleate cis-trans isomerase